MNTTVYPTKALTFIAAVLLGSATLMAAPGKGGTDVLHYSIQDWLLADAAVSNVVGKLDLRHASQGQVAQQSLNLIVRGLEPSSVYQLVIPANPADPASLPVLLSEIKTDKNGNAKVRYHSVAHKNGTLSRGRGKSELPAAALPIHSLTNVAVVDTAGSTVLTGDLTQPDKFNYLVKRNLSTQDIRASLHIVANSNTAQLRLSASGLAPSTDYTLILNGGAPEVFTTDAAGRLYVRAEMETAAEVLQLKTVELLDSTNTVLLNATLP